MTKNPVRLAVAAQVSAATVLAFLAVASIHKEIPFGWFTREPATLYKFHPFAGFLSNLGSLIWCSAAAICLFSSEILRRTEGRRERFWFLVCSALLTLALLFDDALLLHEYFAPRHFGIPEEVVYVFLGTITAIYLLVFRRLILRTEYLVLGVALGYFAVSVAIDAVLEKWLWRIGEWVYLVEDGAKFLGLVSWCLYYARTSYQFLTERSVVLNNPATAARVA